MAEKPATAIRIELFGGFHLHPAAAASPPTARKACALLAYLALSRGRPQPRDKLAALLWPDSADEQARASLRQALAAIRRMGSAGGTGPVAARGADLALAPGVEVDVAEFETLLARNTAAAREQALALYRGDLLDGFRADAPAFEQHLAAERERLRALAVTAWREVAAVRGEAGDVAGAIEAATRLLAIDPLREDGHRALMRLYVAQGRQAAALQQYRHCRALLERELGVPPEAETETLYRSLLQQRRIAAAQSSPGAGAVGDEGGRGPPMAAAPAMQPVRPPAPGLPASGPAHAVVLVAELAGLAAEQDLERAHAAELDFRARFDAVMVRHGGLTCSLGGTRATAVFGLARGAAGDEVRRAVAAGLALCGGAAGEPVPPAQRIGVGIASGQVLASRDEGGLAVSGEPVQIAARIAGAGRAGEVRLSERVCQALAGRLQAERLPAVPLAADGAPLKLWRAVRLCRPGEGAAPQPFVGRDAELALLAGMAAATAACGRGQTVLVRGDPGIGKSRLVEAFAARAATLGYACHKALVLDFGAGAEGDPLRGLACSLLGLGPAADVGERRQRADSALDAGQCEGELQVFLNDLLDVPQPPALRAVLEAMDDAGRERGTKRVLGCLIEAASARQPQLVVVEDVHWAEPRVLEHLAHIAAAIKRCPAVLVMTTRVDNDPVDSAWRLAAGACGLTSVDLGPLSDDEIRRLAASYAQGDDAFVAACVDRAAGNPLFLDQLLRAAGAQRGALPGAVQSIILTRMESLDPADKAAVRAAAVLGQRFPLAALRHLITDPAYSPAALVKQALLLRDGEELHFAHALIQEAAYVSQLKSSRREMHRRAAEWFAERDPVLRAEHLEAAEDPAAALAYLRTARDEAARLHKQRALGLAERGAALAGADRAVQWALAWLRGDLLLDLGRTVQALEVFAAAQELADDAGERCRSLIGIAASLRILDRYDEALAALDRAEAAARAAEMDEALAEIDAMRGNIHFPLGHIDACLEAHERVRRYAVEAASPLYEARAECGLGDAYYQRGHMLTARRHFARCAELSRAHGLHRIELAALPMLGATDFYCNQLRAGLASASSALEVATRLGDARAELLARVVIGSLLVETDGGRDTRAELALALALARRLGARRFEAELLCLEAMTPGGAKRTAECEALLDEAYRLCCETGPHYLAPIVLAETARFAADAARRRWALEEGERLLAAGCVSHCHLHFYRTAIDSAVEHGEWSEVRRYAAALEAYTREEPLPWSDYFIRRARALARWAEGERGGAAAAVLQGLADEARGIGFARAVPAIEAALVPESAQAASRRPAGGG